MGAERATSMLLRYDGAVACDPAIEIWLAAQTPDLAVIASHWFAMLRRCGANVRELMHDGCATACVADAPFAYVGVYTAHVNVGFFQGASLPDPAALLRGQGKRMRHAQIRPGQGFDAASLEVLIAAAHDDIVARLQAGS